MGSCLRLRLYYVFSGLASLVQSWLVLVSLGQSIECGGRGMLDMVDNVEQFTRSACVGPMLIPGRGAIFISMRCSLKVN